MEALGVPTHIILTCNYHERNSAQLKQKWGCEVLLYENHVQEAEIEFEGTFQDCDVLWDLIEVVRVPDVRHREEVSFYLIPDGVLIVGDLLSGGRKDCGIPDGEIGFKDPAYLVDLAKARLSLKALLHLEFEILCFGHGEPILSKAKDVLKRFVECDTTWQEVRRRREEGFRLNPELRNLHRT
jgi:glyoxylase-like metal-dependent hydrolase (beta-lactamase superfamily II)